MPKRGQPRNKKNTCHIKYFLHRVFHRGALAEVVATKNQSISIGCVSCCGKSQVIVIHLSACGSPTNNV